MIPTFRYSRLVFLNALVITLVTLMVSGSAIFLLRRQNIAELDKEQVNIAAENLVQRMESLLEKVELQLVFFSTAYRQLSEVEFIRLLQTTLDGYGGTGAIRALYFLDSSGLTAAVWIPAALNPYNPNLLGIDFSYSKLYRQMQLSSKPVWSDKFVSVVVGDTSVGVGLSLDNGRMSAIVELDLDTLLTTVNMASGQNMAIWVVDRLGEVLVDTTRKGQAGVNNFLQVPLVAAAFSGEELPAAASIRGVDFCPGAALSEKLGWLFLVGLPSGLKNPQIRSILIDVLLFSGVYLMFVLLLIPVALRLVVRELAGLTLLAQKISEGNHGDYEQLRTRTIVREFNDLTGNMIQMAQRIRERETALHSLNQELEDRVAARTSALEASNEELRASLDHNNKMQALLVETEKQAALGRLVAGVAHELNTPIGNAVMAISTLQDEKRQLDSCLQTGLRKSDLDKFLTQSDQGLQIAQRNIARAADLVSSFKHVATDQTSVARRRFELAETIRDILLTVHPMLKRSPHTLEQELAEQVEMDSYPGVIGQIITNLVANALLHAWEDGEVGRLQVVSEKVGTERVRISVQDNGNGIAEQVRKKIFEPFFTTKMGSGGTGLGLNIAQNGARVVLGGELVCESTPGVGTRFLLDIPLVAPVNTTGDAIANINY